MEICTTVKIRLEDGSEYELSSPTYESTDVYQLSREGFSLKIPGTRLQYKVPAFGHTHMLVETPGEEVDCVLVYGVECNRKGGMSSDQVANRVRQVFGADVTENLTAYQTSSEMISESVYPCGTLFTSGSYSNSSSLGSSTPPHLHTPTPPHQRPARLPLSTANLESTLISPKAVAMPNTTLPNNHAIVAGRGSFNVPGDRAFDDSVPANQCREGVIRMPSPLQTLHPVQKVQGVNVGGTVQLGVINLETPEQRHDYPGVKFQVTVEDNDNDPVAPVQSVVPVETSSQESEQRLPSQPPSSALVADIIATNNTSHGNQLVVGLQSRRMFSRQSSCPGTKYEAATTLPRNTSEQCLGRLEGNPFPRRNRSFSNLEQNFEAVIEPGDSTAEEDNEKPPVETPATPTKPLAVERQESVAAGQQNEFVIPKPLTMVLDTHGKTDGQSTHDAVIMENEEPPVSHDSNPVVSDAPQDPPQFCVGSPKESNPGEPPTDHELQVHILEHAMNGYCSMPEVCQRVPTDSEEFAQAVDQMHKMVEEARNSSLDDDLKGYIRDHCQHCKDKECKVPHRMAGCAPAGESFSGSDSTDYQPTPSSDITSSAHQEQQCPISFDEHVNQSTTSEVCRHHENQPPPAVVPQHLTLAQPTSDEPTTTGGGQTVPFSLLLPRPSYHGSPPLVPLRTTFLHGPPTTQQNRLSTDQGSGLPSPMDSRGFNLPDAAPPVPVRGQQYQESQLGAKSYVHQVSDRGLVGRERRQYQYLEPSRTMYGSKGGERRVRVEAGKFPSYSSLPRRPGTIIFSSDESELMPGEVYPCPHNVPDRDKLGKGGNGTVVKFPLGGKEYALKLTSYRESELNIWSPLKHKNILPLKGVMLGEQTRECYQFMDKMTGDLRSMMIDHGDLCTLLQKYPEEWDVVFSNVVYVLEEVLCGLAYLYSQNIQHSDLKANNILIMKKCSCPDIMHCVCPREEKYEVKIADFDSLKKTRFERKPAQFSEISRDPMNEIQLNNVKGTPAYRAPEQFKLCPNRPEFKRAMDEGRDTHDMEGPWCDIWSLGVIILQMALGSHNKAPYINEANILTNSKVDKMHARIESSVATIRLTQLQDHSLTHSELRPLARLAKDCLRIDCRQRPAAKELLNTLQEIVKLKSLP